MTERDDIGVVIRANEELSAVLAKVREGFYSVSLALGEAAKTANEVGAQLADIGGKATENAERGVGALQKMDEAYAKYGERLTAVKFEQELYAANLKSLEAVHESVFQAMEGQLMSFVETNRFSVGALMQVVAKQVMIELVGIAATSAVWAL